MLRMLNQRHFGIFDLIMHLMYQSDVELDRMLQEVMHALQINRAFKEYKLQFNDVICKLRIAVYY